MTPARFAASSGNLLADKRYAYAQALADEGDQAAAADLFAQAIEQAPGWAAAHLARGLALERLGDLTAAQQSLSVAAALDTTGLLGAALHRDRLHGGLPSAMPPAYVAALFDQYASRFDGHLLDALGYRGPQVIAEALASHEPQNEAASWLDLGCGTGLMGRCLTGPGLALDGIDLSAAMLVEAGATGCYRHLWQGDCVAVTNRLQAASYGVAVAADVLVYLGDLRPVCAAVARILEAGGLFAATVETRQGDGYDLGPDLRFRHGESYVRSCLEAVEFTPLRLDACVTRREKGGDVPGLVFVARRS